MEYISSILTGCMSIVVFVPYTLRFWEFRKPIEDSKISWYSLPRTIFIHLPFTWMLMDPRLLCLQTYPELSCFCTHAVGYTKECAWHWNFWMLKRWSLYFLPLKPHVRMVNIHDGSSFTVQRKKNLSFLLILILGEMQYKVWINSLTYH